MSSADTFLSKETTKHNYSAGEKIKEEKKNRKVLEQNSNLK